MSRLVPAATLLVLATRVDAFGFSSSPTVPDWQQSLEHSPLQPPLATNDLVCMVGCANPALLPNDGGQERQGLLNFHQVLSYTGLAPTGRVLEPGCGYGRNARYFGSYLDSKRGGEWHGFDISRDLVEWGTQNLTSLFPHVIFKYVNVYNEHYSESNFAFIAHHGGKKRTGDADASAFIFPYSDNYFDAVYAPSVWTHLKVPDALNYLTQVYRVLKPGGQALINFLFADEHFVLPVMKSVNENPGMVMFGGHKRLIPDMPGVTWGPKAGIEGAIMYNLTWMQVECKKIGFQVGATILGTWADTAAGTRWNGIKEYQDRILLKKPTN